ncbi:hypothetical protein GW17_00034600 [Ensete ventricosum]|nr:hypothetical protein GW17_00034600 [Ensete ventricosum]RZS05010.1 hypothetical protein BHM03_00035439 [Ensete ventricosum]
MRSVSCSTSPKGIAAIVGVGPKLGRSVARKFAHEGYTVAILARDLGKRFLSKLSRFADEIACEAKAQVFAIRIDCSDSKSVREAFEGVLSLGFVEVLVYNASEPPVTCPPTNFTAITVESFERSLAVSAVGAFHCAQQRCRLWEICSEGTVSKPRKGVPIIGNPHRPCNHPRRYRRSKVSFRPCKTKDTATDVLPLCWVLSQIIKRRSKHDGINGSRCTGTDILAHSSAGQGCMDAGDRPAIVFLKLARLSVEELSRVLIADTVRKRFHESINGVKVL